MRKTIVCKECGQEQYNHGNGICHRCYMRIQMRERRKRFPETFHKQDKKRWHGKRREASNQRRKKRYYDNYDSEIKTRGMYRNKNKEKIYAQQKEYYRKNIEVIRVKNRIYNKKRNKEKEFARLYAWVKKQPIEKLRENWRAASQRRMTRKKSLPATLTKQEWIEIKNNFDNRCAYCGEKKKLTQDHVIPLSRGGGYTKENIVPACLSCNSRKCNKTANEYIHFLNRKK